MLTFHVPEKLFGFPRFDAQVTEHTRTVTCDSQWPLVLCLGLAVRPLLVCIPFFPFALTTLRQRHLMEEVHLTGRSSLVRDFFF